MMSPRLVCVSKLWKFKKSLRLVAQSVLPYPGGHVPESGEIMGILKKLKDGMPADLADSLKADEEERKTLHAPLVAAKEG